MPHSIEPSSSLFSYVFCLHGDQARFTTAMDYQLHILNTPLQLAVFKILVSTPHFSYNYNLYLHIYHPQTTPTLQECNLVNMKSNA